MYAHKYVTYNFVHNSSDIFAFTTEMANFGTSVATIINGAKIAI